MLGKKEEVDLKRRGKEMRRVTKFKLEIWPLSYFLNVYKFMQDEWMKRSTIVFRNGDFQISR